MKIIIDDDKFQSNCCGFWPDSMILAYRLINIHQREKLRVNFKSMTEVIIKNAIHYIEELFRKNAGGHDSSHTMRVYRNALLIAESEQECDLLIVALAALLHDVDDHKLFSTQNNANARTFLEQNHVPQETIGRICEVINSVSFSQNKARSALTLEGRIVQDADRLDAMGAVGIARTFAFGGEHGRPMQESIQHFYDKLLRLKDLMNTETGKLLAVKRHAFLVQFLEEYKQETTV